MTALFRNSFAPIGMMIGLLSGSFSLLSMFERFQVIGLSGIIADFIHFYREIAGLLFGWLPQLVADYVDIWCYPGAAAWSSFCVLSTWRGALLSSAVDDRAFFAPAHLKSHLDNRSEARAKRKAKIMKQPVHKRLLSYITY